MFRFCLLGLVLCLTSASLSAAVSEQQVQALLDKVIQDTNAPSLSVAVAHKNKLKVAVTAGFADKGSKLKATPKTKYRTGSIAKVIGTTAFMKLVESGDVSIQDDIRHYLPYMPKRKWPLRIVHLLSHTGGIRHYNFGEYGTNIPYANLEVASRVFRDDDLLFQPGSDYHYTTYGINLIQGVIEAKTGQPLSQFLQANLWQPANMADTQLEMKGLDESNYATGYRSILTSFPVADIDVSYKYIGGGMRSTPSDLVRMVIALNQGKLLNEKTKALMLTPPFPQASSVQALGWRWTEYAGHKAFSHGGAINGFESFLLHLVEPELTIALMVNQDGYDHTSSTTYRVLDLFLNDIAKN